MRLRAVLSFNERQMIRSFLTVSNSLLLTIIDNGNRGGSAAHVDHKPSP